MKTIFNNFTTNTFEQEILPKLKRIPLFGALSLYEIYKLSKILIYKDFEKDSLIIKQGDVSDDIFIILSGAVVVFLDIQTKRKTLAYIVDESVIGELSLIDDSPRSANVQTIIPTKCIIIKKSDLLNKNIDLIITNKILHKILFETTGKIKNILDRLNDKKH